MGVDADFKRIAPDVKLGEGVKIFAFVNLHGCEIGDESKVGIVDDAKSEAKN
jgi:carbonic anhydrase/acetyltransferase-like protein (isoleucine patch superfamily)